MTVTCQVEDRTNDGTVDGTVDASRGISLVQYLPLHLVSLYLCSNSVPSSHHLQPQCPPWNRRMNKKNSSSSSSGCRCCHRSVPLHGPCFCPPTRNQAWLPSPALKRLPDEPGASHVLEHLLLCRKFGVRWTAMRSDSTKRRRRRRRKRREKSKKKIREPVVGTRTSFRGYQTRLSTSPPQPSRPKLPERTDRKRSLGWLLASSSASSWRPCCPRCHPSSPPRRPPTPTAPTAQAARRLAPPLARPGARKTSICSTASACRPSTCRKCRRSTRRPTLSTSASGRCAAAIVGSHWCGTRTRASTRPLCTSGSVPKCSRCWIGSCTAPWKIAGCD
ncbi:hypothetical protein IWZ03DRAFT_121865 [Phyllosticta citriasiana]|uniref:Uncharacterized protein n=1 Tax=Phyllosticta citriasiana TaxID=595635 RepID=A0ABR1K7N3_9PEZI